MSNLNNINNECEHSKAFDRIFALIFFLISQLSIILTVFSYQAGVVRGIVTLSVGRFIAVFIFILLAPLVIVSLVYFIISMVKGKNLVIGLAIYTILISKVFGYSIALASFYGSFILVIDIVLLAITLAVYVILEAILYNKDKGIALGIMHAIKVLMVSFLLLWMLPFIRSMIFTLDDPFNRVALSFFVLIFFLLIEGKYLTTINKRIPVSGLPTSIILFIVGTILSMILVGNIIRKGYSYSEPSQVYEVERLVSTYSLSIAIFFGNLVYTIVLCCISSSRMKRLKEKTINERNNMAFEQNQNGINNHFNGQEELKNMATDSNDFEEEIIPETIETNDESIKVNDSVLEFKKTKEEMTKLGFDNYSDYLDYLEFMKRQKVGRGE